MKTIILVGVFLLGFQAHSDNPYTQMVQNPYYGAEPSQEKILLSLSELEMHFKATNDSKNAELVAKEFSHLNGMTPAEFSDYQNSKMEENDFDLSWPNWITEFGCAKTSLINLANVWKSGLPDGSAYLVFGTSLAFSSFADQKQRCGEAQK